MIGYLQILCTEGMNMSALDIPSIKAEMIKVAKDNLRPCRISRRVRDITNYLENLHKQELSDSTQILLAYYYYRTLFREESAKERPCQADRIHYAVAMNLFAQAYVRLLS